MEVVILPDRAGIGAVAGNAIAELVQRESQPCLGLATGSSPLPIYDDLARRHEEAGLSFAHVHAFALDEYVGLPPQHPESYGEVIRREVTNRLDINPDNVHVPDGGAADLPRACEAYEDSIASSGGIDIQILGVGSDGHIGFNEPASSLTSRTRIKTLTEATRRDNARFFGDLEQVPRHVVTQGLGTILESRHIILVAAGVKKAEAVRNLIEGPVAAMCPASVLQLHPHTTVLLDSEAASQLQLLDYYRNTFADKPSWQGI